MNIIKHYRIKKHLTQKQLAAKCNLKQSYISELENYNTSPSVKTIKILSKQLEVCPYALFEHYANLDCKKNICKEDCKLKEYLE